MSRISALTHDAPGLYGPPDDDDYIARRDAAAERRADLAECPDPHVAESRRVYGFHMVDGRLVQDTVGRVIYAEDFT